MSRREVVALIPAYGPTASTMEAGTRSPCRPRFSTKARCRSASAVSHFAQKKREKTHHFHPLQPDLDPGSLIFWHRSPRPESPPRLHWSIQRNTLPRSKLATPRGHRLCNLGATRLGSIPRGDLKALKGGPPRGPKRNGSSRGHENDGYTQITPK